MFVNILGNILNMYMAEYYIKDGMIWSKNFTNEDIILDHYASYRYKFHEFSINEKTVYKNLYSVKMKPT
ncbi:hypothetical protein SDC9_152664 [bioreactor metagenome]|uniref:Uncharacterized protein n=1 Tax=bioreactor metagenome TaxID=1076179 RepID=A0A645EYC6_9ZZZZ